MSSETTLADAVGDRIPLLLRVVGKRPESRPYLAIMEPGSLPDYGHVLATVENTNALRALAHRILRALGDEPPTPKAQSKRKRSPQ